MKVTVIALFAVWPGIFRIGDWLLSWTKGKDWIQVILCAPNICYIFSVLIQPSSVMGFIPIVMNIVQFWLIDSIVKASTVALAAPDSSPRHSADREPLFEARDEDDEDDNGLAHSHHRRHDIENPPTSSSRTRSIISRKGSMIDERKNLSSGASTVGSNEQDEHDYPPPESTSPKSSGSSTVRPTSRSPAPKRRRSPPPPLRLRNPTEDNNSSGVQVIAIAGTPFSSRKDTHSAEGEPTEKLSSRNGPEGRVSNNQSPS